MQRQLCYTELHPGMESERVEPMLRQTALAGITARFIAQYMLLYILRPSNLPQPCTIFGAVYHHFVRYFRVQVLDLSDVHTTFLITEKVKQIISQVY